MANLKLISLNKDSQSEPAVSCCEKVGAAEATTAFRMTSCCPDACRDSLDWITGSISTPAGPVPRISSEWTRAEYWEHVKCRTSAYRNKYEVRPGLYAIGDPDANSDVIATANYKYSFDTVRKDLKGLNLWVLVLDTKGINVWCA